MDTVNLEAFSIAQMQSKLWMVEKLERVVEDCDFRENGHRIWILAGWYGVTNLLLRTRNKIKVQEVRSYDTDPSCEYVADSINKLWVYRGWEFKAHTADINQLEYNPRPDIVINSSVEHMSSDQWFDLIPSGTLVCLQASDMEDEDHCNKIENSRELMQRYQLSEISFEGIKRFKYGDKLFTRSMIIGVK